MDRFQHQIISSKFMAEHPRCFNTSDPGTGKTITTLDAFIQSMGPTSRLLVLAPLSILKPSWGDDVTKATSLSYAIAHGTPKKREAAMLSPAKVVIANHDAVVWMAKNPKLFAGFTHLAIDEYKVFKHHSRERSKAAKLIASKMQYLWMLSGTPNSETLLDMWHPALMVDGGERLGKKYWDFRSQVCYPKQVGPRPEHVKWVDKPDAIDMVAAKLQDITVRFELEKCIDMPERVFRDMLLPMPPWLSKKYEELLEHALLEVESGTFSAINAGAKTKKLLQLLSGAVYDDKGEALTVHNDRYELVLDLVEEREHCIVAFNWKHELEGLIAEAEKRDITYRVINGDISRTGREDAVDAFQAGDVRVVFAHPQAAGHGLTLTRGTAVIWCSPTYVGEWYTQFNARIYRAGQKQRTEVIRIAYEGTKEIEVYDTLDGKMEGMHYLLNLFTQTTESKVNEPDRNQCGRNDAPTTRRVFASPSSP